MDKPVGIYQSSSELSLLAGCLKNVDVRRDFHILDTFFIFTPLLSFVRMRERECRCKRAYFAGLYYNAGRENNETDIQRERGRM